MKFELNEYKRELTDKLPHMYECITSRVMQ
jgi:hypothetical protein